MNEPKPDHQKSDSTLGVWALAVLGPLVVSGALINFRDEFPATNAALVLVLVAQVILDARRARAAK